MRPSTSFRLSLLIAASFASALAAAGDRRVTIQPILTSSSGSAAYVDYVAYESYANKIMAQANIDLSFLPASLLSDSNYYNLNYNNADSLVHSPGHGQNANPLVINCFFTNRITNAGGGTLYGFGYFDQPYLVLDVTNIKAYSALGRVDTFTHEMGHVLNLPHYDSTSVGSADPNRAKHLMTSGSLRTIPQSLTNVAPDGLGLSLLGAGEIATIRASRFALPVPEPATLVALGLGLLCLRRRRR